MAKRATVLLRELHFGGAFTFDNNNNITAKVDLRFRDSEGAVRNTMKIDATLSDKLSAHIQNMVEREVALTILTVEAEAETNPDAAA